MATVSCHLPILYFELELNFWYFSMYGSWRTFLPAHCPVASVKVHTWGKFIRITWLTMPVLLNSSINFRLLSAANISVLKKLSSQTPPVLNHLHTHVVHRHVHHWCMYLSIPNENYLLQKGFQGCDWWKKRRKHCFHVQLGHVALLVQKVALLRVHKPSIGKFQLPCSIGFWRTMLSEGFVDTLYNIDLPLNECVGLTWTLQCRWTKERSTTGRIGSRRDSLGSAPRGDY